jgi:hypothetical protein
MPRRARSSSESGDDDGAAEAQRTPPTGRPAAKKVKARRSNRKKGSKPLQLKVGDEVVGRFGVLSGGGGSDGSTSRRTRAMLHGHIVAEASADGKKNRWHVQWDGLDASQAESRQQKLTAGGIPSTKLRLALAVSGSDEDNSDGDNAAYEESDSSDSIGGRLR